MIQFSTTTRVITPLLVGLFLGGQSPIMAQMNQKQASSVEFYRDEPQHAPTDAALLTTWRYLANDNGLIIRLFPATEPALVTLLIENQTGHLLTVGINNQKHERLYEENRPGRQSWGRWRFNLAPLPDGTYTLHIQAGKQTINRPFVIETRSPVVYTHERSVVF